MKITINSKVLLAKMAAAAKMLPSKSPVAILNNFRIAVSDGVLSVTASDGDNTMTCEAACMAEGNGAVCIDAKFAIDVCKAAPDGPMTIDCDGTTATLSSSCGKWETPVADANQYPEMHGEEGGTAISLPCSLLKAGLDAVRHAVSDDTYHPQLNGVCVNLTGEKCDFVATDARCLALYSVEVQTEVAKMILPPKSVAALLAVLPDEGECRVTLGVRTALIETGESSVLSSLVKGNYPDYNRVIPQSSPIEARVYRQTLLNAVRRVSLCADQQYDLVRMDVSPLGVTLTCSDIQSQKRSSETIDGEANGNIAIGFSARYLSEALSQAQGETVTLRLADPTRPALVTCEAMPQLTMLLMPMTLNNV